MHPNLARMAATYDQIVEDVTSGRISSATARSKIEQLEARDDEGVRWSIDPDTGNFVRRTAFGDMEYDTPPVSGVASLDPYAVSSPGRDDNPAYKVSSVPADVFAQPYGMAGATRSAEADFGLGLTGSEGEEKGGIAGLWAKISGAPAWTKFTAAGVGVILIVGAAWVTTPKDAADPVTPTPSPSISISETPSPSASPTKKPGKKPKPGKGKASKKAN